jgi:photosystem II stability/assembly factor-like uncharacterized protein
MRRLVLCTLLVLGCGKSRPAVPDGGADDAGADACSLADEPRFDGGQSIPSDNGLLNFFDVWGTAPDNVYAVGTAGLVMRWNGAAWTKEATPAPALPDRSDLLGIWGSGPDDIFAVGLGGTIFHYNATWLAQSPPADDGGAPTTPDLHAVSGGRPGDAWAVGANALVLHTTDYGATWTRVDVPTQETLNGIWIQPGGGAGVAVGNLGTILTYDGSSWSRQRVSGLTAHLKGVYGTDAAHVWVAGLNGTLVSNASGSWQRVDPTAVLPRDRECQQAAAAWPSVYLRDMWAHGGRLVIVGWSGTIMVLGGDNRATVYQVTENRLESVWGTEVIDTPGQGDGGIPDGGLVTHDEVTIVGVTGTVVRVVVP